VTLCRTKRTTDVFSESRFPGQQRRWKPLGIAKGYLGKLERKSGKDYGWIKPLTQPLSRLMKYV
jgi:hypothetical protein